MSNNFQKYFLFLICLFISGACLVSIQSTNAKMLGSNSNENVKHIEFNSELPYKFAVSNKLNGGGAVQLSISKNKINANAKGSGKVKSHSVSLITTLDGRINKKTGDIEVLLEGIADPTRIYIPGKVSFSGPLKGIFEGDVLKLVGTVNVRGFIARRAGFAEYEKVVVEITDRKLCQRLLSMKNRIASI